MDDWTREYAAARDKIADERDAVSDRRDRIADERDAVSDQRDRIADDREAVANADDPSGIDAPAPGGKRFARRRGPPRSGRNRDA
jgi:hypothetical protein